MEEFVKEDIVVEETSVHNYHKAQDRDLMLSLTDMRTQNSNRPEFFHGHQPPTFVSPPGDTTSQQHRRQGMYIISIHLTIENCLESDYSSFLRLLRHQSSMHENSYVQYLNHHTYCDINIGKAGLESIYVKVRTLYIHMACFIPIPL